MFYLREYSTYNLCIYDSRDDQGTMCLWHEVEGRRGVNEVASALWQNIVNSHERLENNAERKLIIWSDRCRGQNNNYYMLALGLLFIKEGYFTSFEQKFLISGHSFLPCDRLFAMIEKRKKVTQAITPEDWIQIIQQAHPSKPFPIMRMLRQNILDMKKLQDYFPRPRNLQVTKIASALIALPRPHEILVRHDHFPGAAQCFFIHHPQRRSVLNLAQINVRLLPCYPNPLQVTNEKKENIKRMFKFMLPHHREYYRNLLGIENNA